MATQTLTAYLRPNLIHFLTTYSDQRQAGSGTDDGAVGITAKGDPVKASKGSGNSGPVDSGESAESSAEGVEGDDSGDSVDDVPTFEIPEDAELALSSDEDLIELHNAAMGHFDTIYGDGNSLTEEDLTSLGILTEGVEAIHREVKTRETARAERAQAAAELASRVRAMGTDSGANSGNFATSDKDDEDGEGDGSDSPEGSEGNGAEGGQGDGQVPAAPSGVPSGEGDGSAPEDETEEERKRREAQASHPANGDALAVGNGNGASRKGPFKVRLGGNAGSNQGGGNYGSNRGSAGAGGLGMGGNSGRGMSTRGAGSGRGSSSVGNLGLGQANKGTRPRMTVAPGVPGFAAGASVDLEGAARVIDAQLQTFSGTRSGTFGRMQSPSVVIRKDFPDELMVHEANDSGHTNAVLAKANRQVLEYAGNETRLPQGSLVASGGWRAPSEIDWSLPPTLASRAGLLSTPEVGVKRGGLMWTQGTDYRDIFAAIGKIGFFYTEEDDIEGKYVYPEAGPGTGPNTVGDKPFYRVQFPDFMEARLDLGGFTVQAGLAELRGYPEQIADELSKIMVAYDQFKSAKRIARMVADSEAIAMPIGQVGTIAPLLTSLELAVQHFRETHSTEQGMSLEVVLPTWIHGVIRADLMRRSGNGADLLGITDGQINKWFTNIGVNPQFVRNWQGIGGIAAKDFTSWPATAQFLIYPAGTWVWGTSDVIRLDTIYDTAMLAQNDYTALFIEEGQAAIQRLPDSRIYSVPIVPSGAAGASVDISGQGTSVDPAPVLFQPVSV